MQNTSIHTLEHYRALLLEVCDINPSTRQRDVDLIRRIDAILDRDAQIEEAGA